MKNKKTRILVILSTFLAIFLLYFFFVPLVEYREPELPSLYSSRLTHPKSSFSYIVGKEGGLLSRIKSPSLIVYSPLMEVEDTEKRTLQWGRFDSKATYSIVFSKTDMYRFVLESNPDKLIGFLFDENDRKAVDIYNSLSSDYSNLVPVSFYDRVSVINKDEIKKSLDSLWGFIVYDGEKSSEAWRDVDSKIIMDPVSASAAVSVDRVIAITPDWNTIIKSALRGDDISFDYTLTVLEN